MLPLITWYSVAPPVGTTIWMCVLLGFTAPIAMEIVLLTNLLAPFTGPFLGEFLLGASVPVSSATLCLRILAILGSGLLLALLAKYTLGEDQIEESRHQFDGVSTIAMLAFLLPVFDGIGVMAISAPFLACACLGLAFGLNFGTQAIVFIISRSLLWCQVFSSAKQVQLPEGARSVAVVAGNRNLGCILLRFRQILCFHCLSLHIKPRSILRQWLRAGLQIVRATHDDISIFSETEAFFVFRLAGLSEACPLLLGDGGMSKR